MAEAILRTTTSILYIGFTMMLLASIMCGYFAYSQETGRRTLHYVSLILCGIASLSYLSMATHNGYVVRPDGRVFFYARYIDWLLTTPLLLYDLAAVAGLERGKTFGVIGLDILMVIFGLIGALSLSPDWRWLFWAFGMLTFAPIVYVLWSTFETQAVEGADDRARKLYSKLLSLTVITWAAYPVVWAVGEGAGVIDQTSEVLMYMILDVIAKGVFAFLLLHHQRTYRQVPTGAPEAPKRERRGADL